MGAYESAVNLRGEQGSWGIRRLASVEWCTAGRQRL